MPSVWFIRSKGKVFGPLDSRRLKELAAAGKIDASTEVAKNQDGPWYVARRVKGLKLVAPQPRTKNASRLQRPSRKRDPAPDTKPPHREEPSEDLPKISTSNDKNASLIYSGTSHVSAGFRYVTVYSNGPIIVNGNTAAEAQAAIKELRILKKTFSLQKRSVQASQKAIRAQYTDRVRRRGSMVRGGGVYGRLERRTEAMSRDAARAELAQKLSPLEAEKQNLEHAIIQVDSLIAQVESQALRMR